MTTLIVFSLAVRLCGTINVGCHYEHVSDYSNEAFCRAAGAIMMLYPRTAGYRCTVVVREYHLHAGNWFNETNPY